MRTRIPLLLIALLCVSVRADQDDIPALVKELADDTPRTRDLASVHLRRLGRDALPALRDALKSDDPEVASRARAIIKGIEDDFDPRKPVSVARDRFAPGVDWPRDKIILQPPVVDHFQTRREVIANDNGRMVRITQDFDGITLLTREMRDGRDQVKITRAATPEELKREHPEEYALYARYYLAPRADVADRNLPRTVEEARRFAEEHRRQVLEQQQKMREQLEEARRRMMEQRRQLEP